MCECGAGLMRKSYKVPKHTNCGLSKTEWSRKHQGRGLVLESPTVKVGPSATEGGGGGATTSVACRRFAFSVYCILVSP